MDHRKTALELLASGLNHSEVARRVGVHRKTVRRWLDQSSEKPAPAPVARKSALGLHIPEHKGGKAVYLLTSVQNNTKTLEPLLENLIAYAEYRKARMVVGGFIYRKDAQGQRGQEKTHKHDKEAALEWDARLKPYMVNHRLNLAPDLVWCGEMNTIPTAERPLSGLTNYTGAKSAIFPHPKVALESIATAPGVPAKMVYTTGALSEPNYIQRKAGLKAEFHHVQGALVVEVEENGDWFVRQLNADSTGSFYDLDVYVSGGRVSENHAGLEAINWGDIHEAFMEDDMRRACWGSGGIIDEMRPRHQFLHDLLHFLGRSHHNLRDPHQMYAAYVEGQDDVEAEVGRSRAFLEYASRPTVQTHVVCSNHDNALGRWLRETSHRDDPVNAVYYLEASLASYKAIRDRDESFNLMHWAMHHAGLSKPINFLTEDDSFVICESYGGIECAHHGHLGPNGVRGTPQSFRGLGVRYNIGHMHSASILDGVFVAGVQGALKQGYNKGLSSWSHSMIFTYPNGKRQIITMRNLKYRASR